MRKRKWLAGVTAMGIVMSLSIPVFASEPQPRSAVDSRFDEFGSKVIGFNSSQKYDSVKRTKDNYSSHYIKNDTNFTLNVVSRSATDEGNRTRNGRAIVPPGQYLIVNFVKEMNKTDSCYLSITTYEYGVSGELIGKWSPDSVGDYPVAN